MAQYIDKFSVVAEIEEKKRKISPNTDWYFDEYTNGYVDALKDILSFLDSLEVKDMDLIINTIIAECCDWLTICTDLSLDFIEDCRNLMLAVKEEQFKVQKGE